MSGWYPPHPDGTMPLYFTWTCEVCRPRVVRLHGIETLRDQAAVEHEVDFHPPHTVTRGTMRGAHT